MLFSYPFTGGLENPSGIPTTSGTQTVPGAAWIGVFPRSGVARGKTWAQCRGFRGMAEEHHAYGNCPGRLQTRNPLTWQDTTFYEEHRE